LATVFGKYIPGFEYELVDLKTYSAQEILRFTDILSLVMLIDRIGTIEGGGFLEKLPEDYLEKLKLKIPENLTKILGDVVRVLLDRFNAPKEEAEAILEGIDGKEVGTMFDALVERYHRNREEGIRIGTEKTREEERERTRREKLESARKLKNLGGSAETIRAVFGLSPEEIKDL
jgi:hypothetical protein